MKAPPKFIGNAAASSGSKTRGGFKLSAPKPISPVKKSPAVSGVKGFKSISSTPKTLRFRNPFSRYSRPKTGVTGFGRGGAMSGTSHQTDLSGTVK